MANIAARLRQAREAKNLTYGELARAADIPSRQTIYNIETGRQAASVEQLEKLAAALGVSPAWLTYGTKEG
jgi:transcriptional regulator with XRE-family HTH domain